MKASRAQRAALLCVRSHAKGGTYMPYADQARSFAACERRGWLAYRHMGEPGVAANGYELTAEGAAIIADETPDHLKLGYEHHRERERIRAHLVKRGWDRKDMRFEFRVTRIQERIAKYRPTFRERQQAWLARQPKRVTTTFTVEELTHMIEHFAFANDPIGQAIHEKAKSCLTVIA